MARVFIAAVLLSCALHGQQAPAPAPTTTPAEPPEEDPGLKPREYSFNPVQAKKEVVAGNFYFKKGNYRAAAQRFTEATLWDSGSPEAFLRLGESEEKLGDLPAAREAYTKYIAISEDPKVAESVKKKIAKWPDPKAPPKTPTQK